VSATGDLDRTRELAEQAIRLAEQVGRWALPIATNLSARVAELAGDYERALALTDEAIAAHRKRGAPRRLWAWHLINVGWLAMELHDFARAKSALEEYVEEPDAPSRYIGVADAHSNLGLLALYEGDRDAAAFHFREALEGMRDHALKAIQTEVLHGLAAVAAIDGDPELAFRLWQAAEAQRQAIGRVLSPPEQFIEERYLDRAANELADEVRERARAEGNSMTLDEAVDLALQGVPVAFPQR
jgi:tetratricopeptide (TPR) repeat protein